MISFKFWKKGGVSRAAFRSALAATLRYLSTAGAACAVLIAFSLINLTHAQGTTETFATVVDDQGPDQLDQANDSGSSQQDITGARIGSQGSFGWAWDEIDLSGNNSIDTCTYFEEPDGTVVSACYSVQFEPDGSVTSGFPQFELYDCGTTYSGSQQKCTGNNPVSADYNLSCDNPMVVSSFFTPDDQPDLQADCKLTLPNGDPAGLLLLNTCTKTSASPSSNSNDCLFSDPVGFLELEKVVTGGPANPTDFTIAAGGLSGNGIVQLAPVPANTPLTLSETSSFIDNGTYEQLSVVCTDIETGATVGGPSSVTVDVGQRVSCVFTNEEALQPPVAEVIKGSADGKDLVGSVDEPGGEVTIPVEITNTGGDATLTSLTDDPYGDITSVQNSITQTTCAVPVDIPAGDSYSCEFTVSVQNGPIDELPDTVTATLSNAAGSSTDDDEAFITVNDVPSSIEVVKTANPTSVDEPGADVTFTFVVNNTSAVDSVDITSLTDSIYGDLNGQGNCLVPQTIAAGANYTCAITEFVDSTETNVVTASGADDDGNPLSDTDDSTVTVNDVPSSIEVVKTANPTSVSVGDTVTYTFSVTNTSTVDSVDITSLMDSIYGNLNGQGDCSVSQTLAAGENYTCSISVTVGAAGQVFNVLTVEGVDDDGVPVSGEDTAIVTVVEPEPPVEDPFPSRTIGYWKTHPQAVNAYFETNHPFSICGITVSNFCSAYPLLNAKGGGLNNFKRQATAAQLNCDTWGCPEEIRAAISSCDASQASNLDDYNNGEGLWEGISADGIANPPGHQRADNKYYRLNCR